MKKIKSRKIFGSEKIPRICIFRSNRYIYAQAIDDDKRTTLSSCSSLDLESRSTEKKVTKRDQSKLIGLKLAEKLKKAGITKAVFDRNRYVYHGRVAAVAEGLREGGIII